jgi:hypothetical protein
VKLDVDALLTVPAVPPSAGPDRALEPAPPDPSPLGAAPDGLLLGGAAPDGLLLEIDGWLLLELDGALVHAPTATAMVTAAAAMEPVRFPERIGGLLNSMADSESLATAGLR